MIKDRYILFAEIPIFRKADGKLLCDQFWAKELKMHSVYISDFHLCCPVIEEKATDNLDELAKTISYFGVLEDITNYNIGSVIPLRHSVGWLAVIKNFIPNFLIVKNAISPDTIVHSSGAGWPFPISYYLLPLEFFYKFHWIMLIESTFFMMNKGDKFSLTKFIGHHLHTFLLRNCMKKADARIFTSDHYKNLFLKSDENVHIAEYSNLDSQFLVTEEKLVEKYASIENRAIRFLIACRLVPEKGIYLLFDAIKKLEKNNVKCEINIMGSGELEQECRDFVKSRQGAVKSAFIDPVPYGDEFISYLSNYDVLLMPNLSQEQPRIVFDAFGQGLSIIASDTDGLKKVCQHGQNAIIFKQGNDEELASAISHLVENKRLLAQMGESALHFARTKTHQAMHKNREAFLRDTLGLSS